MLLETGVRNVACVFAMPLFGRGYLKTGVRNVACVFAMPLFGRGYAGGRAAPRRMRGLDSAADRRALRGAHAHAATPSQVAAATQSQVKRDEGSSSQVW